MLPQEQRVERAVRSFIMVLAKKTIDIFLLTDLKGSEFYDVHSPSKFFNLLIPVLYHTRKGRSPGNAPLRTVHKEKTSPSPLFPGNTGILHLSKHKTPVKIHDKMGFHHLFTVLSPPFSHYSPAQEGRISPEMPEKTGCDCFPVLREL